MEDVENNMHQTSASTVNIIVREVFCEEESTSTNKDGNPIFILWKTGTSCDYEVVYN